MVRIERLNYMHRKSTNLSFETSCIVGLCYSEQGASLVARKIGRVTTIDASTGPNRGAFFPSCRSQIIKSTCGADFVATKWNPRC